MRTCLNCGQAADKEAKFCQKCGAPLPVDFDETSEFSKTPPRWVLSLQSGAASEGLINIALQARTRIGRAAESEITLNSKNISRNHSVIEYSPAGFHDPRYEEHQRYVGQWHAHYRNDPAWFGLTRSKLASFNFWSWPATRMGRFRPAGSCRWRRTRWCPRLPQTFAMPTPT